VNTGSAAAPSITVRPSPAEKARFGRLAVEAGLSESALALYAIRAYLGTVPAQSAAVAPPQRLRATDRVTIRMRPGDGQWIARRAAERRMRPCAYLAALVRAHIGCHPPLPQDEIRILKRAVVVVGEMARIVGNKSPTELTCDDLQHARAAVEHVGKQLQAFAKASVIAWESRVG
jgi:hypothetical protein